MRLTHVAHLRLPFGALRSYEISSVPDPEVRLPVSFDQARHVGAGDRSGSWMAISLRLREVVDPEDLGRAWLDVVERHGTLRTAFVREEDGSLGLHPLEVAPGRWVEHGIAPGRSMNAVLQEVLDRGCRPFGTPSHRLCMIDTADGPTLLVAADHAHVDMWSMLVLARDLLAALADVRAGREPEGGWVPAFAEHTAVLEHRGPVPEEVRRRWAEILAAGDEVLPRFPLPLATAPLTRVTRAPAPAPLRAVFPVHSRAARTWHDSVGWFITNSVLESADPEPAAAGAAVKEAISLGSWPLAEVLAPWGGMPEAPGMFAVSWLDLRRLPVRIDDIGLEAQYVSSAIRTDGVMLWFVIDDAGMHLRCRYPDTAEARANVGSWLDALVRALREAAATSVGSRLTAGGEEYRVERARREDLPEIVALLADDELGRSREGADLERYESALAVLTRDPAHHVAVVRAADGHVAGTMQITVLPGISRSGTTRLQIEGVRVAAADRSRGLGTAMFTWAHEHGRARGAALAQLTTDLSRSGARAFYARLGYEESHAGLKRPLWGVATCDGRAVHEGRPGRAGRAVSGVPPPLLSRG